ncbi:hypothetical protein B0J17DRAFT_136426 [Rhizoctonia solani]|nr:hypothetical protein B0J17DRAFT_136426 [Rhizoctonia solani]
MSLLLNRLPVEIRTLVLGQQSPRELASATLVCQEWQKMVFPYLYHTVYLSGVDHLEILTKRLSKKNVPNSLSVSVHLKCLKISGSIESEDLHQFDSIIPRLIHLSSLYWELDWAPENLFSMCPKLKSVHLVPGVSSTYMEETSWMGRLPS